MVHKNLKELIKVILISGVPALLSYLSNSSLIFDKLISLGYIGDSINISLIQDYCLWISIIWTCVFISLNLYIKKIRYNNILHQRNQLIKMNKKVLSSSLGKRFLFDSTSFNIRIFVPKYPLLYKLLNKNRIIKIHRKFIIKNIDLISDQGITKNLQFEVEPVCEGLVGMCYFTKAMVYDDDLENNNEIIYKLNKNQINRTSDLKWSICCPIFDNADNVIAIIALDGKEYISLDDSKISYLKSELVAFSCMLYDSVPHFFKRR